MDITDSRLLDLFSEVDKILSVGHLSAGEAAKLLGKYQFALVCRVGRPGMQALVRGQYFEKRSKLSLSSTSALRTLHGALWVCQRHPVLFLVDEPAHDVM